jgi:regulator of protease activity HflC (stomatin/prohibitin superfamily)
VILKRFLSVVHVFGNARLDKYNVSGEKMETSLALTLAAVFVLAIFVLTLVGGSYFTVESGSAGVIQRFGKFHRTAAAGLNFKLPLVESKFLISLKIVQVDIKMDTKTKDNVFVTIPVAIQYAINPLKVFEAVYSMTNPQAQMESIVNNILLGHIPSMDFDEVYLSQPKIALEVKAELDKEMAPVGYNITRVLVTDIVPSADVRQAMDNINIANRNQVSAKAQGEADRIKIVAKANAEAEAKALQGQGIANERIAIAKGFQEAIDLIKVSAEVTGEDAYAMLLFTNWTDMLAAVGSSPNSTVVFVPSGPAGLSDFQQQIFNMSALNKATAKAIQK